MSTVSVDNGVRERVHAAIVSAIRATGTGGLVRAVDTISDGFNYGFTVPSILKDAEVVIAATKTRDARVGNQPTHVRLVNAAYALHSLRAYTTASEALDWATVLGKELTQLVDLPNTSAEVRVSTITNLFEAKAAAKAKATAEAAEARKALARVAPKLGVALVEAMNLLGDEYTLDAETLDTLAILRETIDSIVDGSTK